MVCVFSCNQYFIPDFLWVLVWMCTTVISISSHFVMNIFVCIPVSTFVTCIFFIVINTFLCVCEIAFYLLFCIKCLCVCKISIGISYFVVIAFACVYVRLSLIFSLILLWILVMCTQYTVVISISLLCNKYLRVYVHTFVNSIYFEMSNLCVCTSVLQSISYFVMSTFVCVCTLLSFISPILL